ncbi:MAG TPA: phenylalanine--tRNA ligase subunit beta, partial [Planctomycetes bacterium]|nr:phenylalanine--tRNA ligase subunit beta [Planctomycetota bacterium]
MLVSYEWLKDYVEITETPEELARLLTRIGLSVESIRGSGDDAVLELEVTTNRPDCLGHLGVAREIALATGRKLSPPPLSYEETADPVQSLAKLSVKAKDLCPRYTARVVRGVTICDSPDWMKRRLSLVGLRPINNIVDVTNYVLLEYSQPLHAFDYELITRHHVIVRRARPQERMMLLDGTEARLPEGACVIADAVEPIALAGVMGGANSEINSDTDTVLIESALFNPVSIRRTARALGVSTESSYRFERSVDPVGVDLASRRAVRLILETAGGAAASGVLDTRPKPFKPVKTKLTLAGIRRILGMDVPAEKVEPVLAGLGCSFKKSGKSAWSVANPSWRPDLAREADYIEEAARIIGYDEVPERVALSVSPVTRTPQERAETAIRNFLLGAGFDEVLTDSFLTKREDSVFLTWSSAEPLTVANPVREGQDVLRRSLIPSLLITARHNFNHGAEKLSIFEVGRVYLSRPGEQPEEKIVLALLSTEGLRTVRGAVDGLFAALHAEPFEWRVEAAAGPGLSAADTLAARSSGALIAVMGTLPPDAAAAFDVKRPAAVAEIALSAAAERIREPKYTAPARFPAVERDVAVIVDEALPWLAVEQAVRKTAPEMLAGVRFIEVYRGKQAGPGRKSFAFQMIYRSPDRTLTDGEVNAAHQRFLDA